jgi:hypothetical protein
MRGARQLSLLEPSVDNGSQAAFRRNSDTSKAAADIVNRGLAARQARVLDFIRRHGTATCKEVARAFDVDMNAVSGRLTELHEKVVPQAIVKTGEKRDGCAVYAVRK